MMAMAATAATRLSSGTLGAQTSSQHRPNILFIMADQHRGGCLRADGNPDIRTPNLDILAKEGARLMLDFCYATQ